MYIPDWLPPSRKMFFLNKKEGLFAATPSSAIGGWAIDISVSTMSAAFTIVYKKGFGV